MDKNDATEKAGQSINKNKKASVKCVHTLSSDPAHPHFKQNCLPNEEQMDKTKKFTYCSKKKTGKETKMYILEGLRARN